MRSNLRRIRAEIHPFHLVNASPWPILMAIAIFALVTHLVQWFHFIKFSQLNLFLDLFLLNFYIFRWFYDIMVEATYEGHHTSRVRNGIRQGMVLFIISEVMFFFSFFWAYFHSALSPSVVLGCNWPYFVNSKAGFYITSIDILKLNPLGLSLLNTSLLLSSGFSITIAHFSITAGQRRPAIKSLFLTICFGFIFLFTQFVEYQLSSFSINDGIIGSLFFLLTGFHGLHVIIGTIFLCVCFVRLNYYHFLRKQHVGFECCSWYWHFVDVIWLILYIVVYIWGN